MDTNIQNSGRKAEKSRTFFMNPKIEKILKGGYFDNCLRNSFCQVGSANS